MPGYCTVKGDLIFFDREVEGLSDAAFRLMNFCFYGPGRTVLGVRRFTPHDPLPRLPSWDGEKAQAALDELLAAGLVEHDPRARLLFFAPHFDHAPIRGLNSIRGAVKVVEELPDSTALIRPLEHLLKAIDLEIEKPGGSKAHSELTDLAGEFEARLTKAKALVQLPRPKTPGNEATAGPEAPSEGVSGSKTQADTPFKGGRKGVSRCQTQADTPFEGGREGVSGNETQADTPLEGGREGVSPRARALPEPDPDPEPNPPLKPPPSARASPGHLELMGQGGQQGRQKGQGKGKYGHLDQRKH